MPVNNINKQSGVALLMVIWLMTLFSLIASNFILSMRRESMISEAVITNAELNAMCESWLNIAVYMLYYPDAEQRWLANGVIYRVNKDNAEYRIRITSEAGKVDINSADKELLEAVINAANDQKLTAALVGALIDWRDADNEMQQNGAEKEQYQRLGLSYSPSNKPFTSLDELQSVLGFDGRILKKLRPWITIYSDRKVVDFNLSTPMLLAVFERELKGYNPYYDYIEKKKGVINEGDPDKNSDSQYDSNQDNAFYTVTVHARLKNGANSIIEAVIKYDDTGSKAYEVMDWRQGNIESSLFDGIADDSLVNIKNESKHPYKL